MEMDVRQRIKQFLNSKNVKNRALANMIGVSEKTLNNKLNGARGLDIDTVQSIILQYEDVSPEWILTGKGEMLKPSKTSSDSNDVNTSYNGTFTKPVVTDIKNIQGNMLVGNGSFTGGDNTITDGSSTPKKAGCSQNTGKEVIEQRIDIEKLKAEIERLNAHLELKDAIIENKDLIIADKERMINFLLEKK